MCDKTGAAAKSEARDQNSTTTGPTTNTTGPTTQIGRLRFDLLQSALYHDVLQIKAERTHKCLLFLSVLLGSGAIVAFGAQIPILGQAAGLVIALVSAAQLVWNFGGLGRDHKELQRRYYILLSEAEDVACDVTDIRRRMTVIYADEPPINDKVRHLTHNQAGRSLFGKDFKEVGLLPKF